VRRLSPDPALRHHSGGRRLEVIEQVARQEGFEFRVPKRHAHNPKNEPNAPKNHPRFSRKSGQDEYSSDRSANLIVYARPIRLTVDC